MTPRKPTAKAPPGADPAVCAKCSQPHGRCTAHNRRGEPCGRHPIRGGAVCPMHGGKAPRAKRAAQRRVAEAEAVAAVAKFGLLKDVAPADALLEEVKRAANMVDFYAEKIRRADPDTDESVLTWGLKDRRQVGTGQFPGTNETWTAAPTVLVDLWMRERKHLAEVAAAAVRADAELHASQAGALVVQVMWPPASPGGQPVPVVVGGGGALPAGGA